MCPDLRFHDPLKAQYTIGHGSQSGVAQARAFHRMEFAICDGVDVTA
jgi:hypothetical protein